MNVALDLVSDLLVAGGAGLIVRPGCRGRRRLQRRRFARRQHRPR